MLHDSDNDSSSNDKDYCNNNNNNKDKDNKDNTNRTVVTASSDSASDSSLNGVGATHTACNDRISACSPETAIIGATSTQNDVVVEKEQATYFRSYWDELSALQFALKEGGPREFCHQFLSSSTSWSVKLLLLLPCLLVICLLVAVIVLNSQATTTLDKSSSSALDTANLNDSNPVAPTTTTTIPSSVPSDLPSMVPSIGPSSLPSQLPSIQPSGVAPTPNPTPRPTQKPTRDPTPLPTPHPPTLATITYVPGKLTRRENGLLLSEGLRSRLVARTGQRVMLDGKDHVESDIKFHDQPDGAAVFENPNGDGGWVYVSNSEVKERNQGGVGGIYFDRYGRTIDYKMLLKGQTTANCSGGKTPWNTWVSCEEIENGRVMQVDPFGNRNAQEMTMDRGFFEAFAHDIRDSTKPRFFVTEDKERGPIRRFTPSEVNWDDPWELLHGPGDLEYLVLEPRGNNQGTFRWTTDKLYAKTDAQMYYPYTEGIDVWKHQMFFTSKERRELFVLDLDMGTFEKQSTVSGVFDGMPDQVKRIVNDGLLYFCEEGGLENGVHARDENGWFFTIVETDSFNDESTGLAFSPDGKRMYVAFQHSGKIFDIWREDGLPFHGQTLSVRYHEFREQR